MNSGCYSPMKDALLVEVCETTGQLRNPKLDYRLRNISFSFQMNWSKTEISFGTEKEGKQPYTVGHPLI